MKKRTNPENKIFQSTKKELRETPQDRINSALSSTAHSDTLCELSSEQSQAIKSILYVIEGGRDIPPVLSAVCELLFMNGCRISEVLKISGKDISPNLHIKITGSKRSLDRIIRPALGTRFWLGMRNFQDTIGDIYTRFWFYHEFKKRGISLKFDGYKNSAVTHAPRHLYINELSKMDKDLTLTQRSVGHKSLNSTNHYVKKTRS